MLCNVTSMNAPRALQLLQTHGGCTAAAAVAYNSDQAKEQVDNTDLVNIENTIDHASMDRELNQHAYDSY